VTIILFFFSLVCYSLLSADAERTIIISNSDNLCIPINSFVFLIAGILIAIINIKKIFYLPKVLILSGFVFAIYLIINILIKISLGQVYNNSDIFYSLIELINIILSIIIAYCFITSVLITKKRNSLYNLSLTIIAILFAYLLAIYFFDTIVPAVKQIIGLGIKIDDLSTGIDKSIGYRRLYGPLGGSTSLGIILIPISGYFLHLYTKKSKIFYILIVLSASFLIVLTASRAALIGQTLLLILFFFVSKKRIFLTVSIALLALMIFLSVGTKYSIDIPEKFHLSKIIFDQNRVLASKTTLKAWLSSSTSFFLGVGYNKLVLITKDWNLSTAGIMIPEKLVLTEYGFLPRGPHSIFNWVISGSGLIGFVLRCSFIYYFIYRLFIKTLITKSKKHLIMPFSILFSMIILFTDDSHVLYPMLMACWFIFYIYSYNIISKHHSKF